MPLPYQEKKRLLCRIWENRLSGLWAGILIVVCLIAFGCGKKELPVPPPQEIPPPVMDLSGRMENTVLTLTWSLPQGNQADDLTGFKVYRSTSPQRQTDCPDCPIRFQLFEDVPIMESNFLAGQAGKMVFRKTLQTVYWDTPVTREADRKLFYLYKVIGYTDDFLGSPDSNIARVAIPPVLIARPDKKDTADE